MQLASVLILASGTLAVSPAFESLAKRADWNPECREGSCWALCKEDGDGTGSPAPGVWKEGDPWCWLWTGDGGKLNECGDVCPSLENSKCLRIQTFSDKGGCSPDHP